MRFLILNGCNLLTNTHAFNWAGSTSSPMPPRDVECGCGAFILQAHTGEMKPSKYLAQQIEIVAALADLGALGGQDEHKILPRLALEKD